MEESSVNHSGKSRFSRREFLKVTAAGAGAGFTTLGRMAASGRLAAPRPKAIPVGVQLYSVREEAAKGLPSVLEAIGKMGYKGVEFAGYYGWEKNPKSLRKLLDHNGLKCCGTHTDLDSVTGEALKATAELHHALGNKFLIVPSLSANEARGWEELAKRFNEIAARAGALGMRVGYHAHAGDFKKFDGRTSWEIFFDNAHKNVIMQLDTGNCMQGGGDPVAMLKRYPGRSTTVHLKEFGGPENAVIGQGRVPWSEVFEICETAGGTEWYIVEHETGPDPIGDIKGCLEGLRKMGRGLA
jgi:sugar phosphate isomerase/epimerase